MFLFEGESGVDGRVFGEVECFFVSDCGFIFRFQVGVECSQGCGPALSIDVFWAK